MISRLALGVICCGGHATGSNIAVKSADQSVLGLLLIIDDPERLPIASLQEGNEAIWVEARPALDEQNARRVLVRDPHFCCHGFAPRFWDGITWPAFREP